MYTDVHTKDLDKCDALLVSRFNETYIPSWDLEKNRLYRHVDFSVQNCSLRLIHFEF